MELSTSIKANCFIYDLETLKCCFLAGFYHPDTKEYKQFEISEFKNDIYQLIIFYDAKNIEYAVGYNNLGFDAQVLEYIRRNYEFWYDMSNLEICGKIYSFVQKLIEDQNHNQRLPYYAFNVKQLDCFTIGGWDNEQRRMGLKGAEFALDMPSVEEMPIYHGVESLSAEQIVFVSSYMRNDIEATYILFKLLLGDTPHPLYKGKNALALRIDIKNEFNIDCLNYSDIKIGEELMKVSYAAAIKKKVGDIPRKGTFRKTVRLRDCIPSYIQFSTPYLQKLLKRLQGTRINQFDGFEEKLVINGRRYTLAKGGLHSDQDEEIWRAQEGYLIEDDDCASFYPKILLNNKYYPAHLGEELLETYEKIYNKRIELKPKAKSDKKIEGIVEAFKLSLNSVFGKMGSMESWLFDMKAMFSITITGELTLLMLLEKFEENGIKVISANSDGITTLFHESKKELKDKLVKEWQEITNFEIETVRFKAFYYQGVNSYLAIKENGEIKKKGLFVTDSELHKNKSGRIRALALEEYFTKGTSPIEFIPKHSNIYDFCIRAKCAASNDNFLEMVYLDGRREQVGKLVRYYITSDKKDAPELYKRGTGTTGKPLNVNQQASNDIGRLPIKYFNQFEEGLYDINYPQYIYSTLKVIAAIEGNKKDVDYVNSLKPTKQLDLFI